MATGRDTGTGSSYRGARIPGSFGQIRQTAARIEWLGFTNPLADFCAKAKSLRIKGERRPGDLSP